jgi:hypothetical protein
VNNAIPYRVFKVKNNDFQQLKAGARNVVAMVSQTTLQKTWTEVEYTLDTCRASICAQTELYKGREWSKKQKLPEFVFVTVQTIRLQDE